MPGRRTRQGQGRRSRARASFELSPPEVGEQREAAGGGHQQGDRCESRLGRRERGAALDRDPRGRQRGRDRRAADRAHTTLGLRALAALGHRPGLRALAPGRALAARLRLRLRSRRRRWRRSRRRRGGGGDRRRRRWAQRGREAEAREAEAREAEARAPLRVPGRAPRLPPGEPRRAPARQRACRRAAVRAPRGVALLRARHIRVQAFVAESSFFNRPVASDADGIRAGSMESTGFPVRGGPPVSAG